MPIKPFKIAVMASSTVGHRTLGFLVARYPSDLVAVVFLDDADRDQFLSAQIGESENRLSRIPKFVWADVKNDPEILAAFRPDVLLLAWWPHLLKKRQLESATKVLNFHPSLLPYGRGKDPNVWSIVDQTPFGVTIHHVVEQTDAGPIAFQRNISIQWTDTGATIYARAVDAIFELFTENYETIRAGVIPSICQDDTIAGHHFRRDLNRIAALKLDQEMKVRDMLNLLRAKNFPPHPGCRFFDGGKQYDVTVNIKEVE